MRSRVVSLLWLIWGKTEGLASSKSPKTQKSANKNNGNARGGFGRPTTPAVVSQRPYTPDDSERTKNLIALLLAQECEGIEADGGLEIGYSTKTGMRGLFAKEAFEQGEFLCAIPFTSALVMEQEEKDPITDAQRGINFIRRVLDNVDVVAKWGPYLETLPTRASNFDPTPDFYSIEEIAQLEFPRIINEAMERKLQIEQLSLVEGVDLAELQFATWLVKSRAFTVLKLQREIGKVSTQSVLIPYFDMINHSSDQSNVKLEVVETKAEDESFYSLCATRAIPAGKEITISYGSGEDSAVELLMNYGFIPLKNPNDRAMLEFGGDGCLTTAGQWSTTFEDDEALAMDATGNMRTVLAFRMRLKQVLRENSIAA